MNTKEIFLAADSGGSKTKWSLITSEGKRVFELETDGLGAVKEGILPVEEIIYSAFSKMKSYGDVKSVFLSLGGPNIAEVERNLKNIWKDIPVMVERESNGNAILFGASFFDCRSVVMCGTGSTAVGYKDNVKTYCGGWGPIYGDGGSGGGMGTSALRSYLRYIDGIEDVGACADLFSFLSEGLDIKEYSDRMELKSRALNLSRKKLASLVPEIYKLFEKGDCFAEKLFKEASIEVAYLANSVSENVAGNKVLLCGGFFKNKPLFLDMCRKEFSKISRAELFYNEVFNPILAAEIMVLYKNKINITKKIFNKILKGE